MLTTTINHNSKTITLSIDDRDNPNEVFTLPEVNFSTTYTNIFELTGRAILNVTFIVPEAENVQTPNDTLITNSLSNLGEIYVTAPINVQVESSGQNFVIGQGNVLVQLIKQSPELWHAIDSTQQQRLLQVLLNPTKIEGSEFAARLHMMMDLMEITMEDIRLDAYNLLLRPTIFATLANDDSSTAFTPELSDLVSTMLVGIVPEMLRILQSEFAEWPVENEVPLLGDENSEYAEDQKEDI